MSKVVFGAGLTLSPEAAPGNPKRDSIKLVRAVLRNPQATDDEVDDALEALLEISKD